MKNSKEYNKKYYEENREKRKRQILERNRAAIERNREWLREFLQDKKCFTCGFSDPRALQFDHIDSLEKKYNISNMITGAYSLQKIMDEIEKCQILCANCHSIKTCSTFNYHKQAGLA